MVCRGIREHQTISWIRRRAARVCGGIVRHGEKDLEISSAFAAETVGHCMTFSWAGHLRYQIVLRGRETVDVAGQRQGVVLLKVKLPDCHGLLPFCYSNRRCGSLKAMSALKRATRSGGSFGLPRFQLAANSTDFISPACCHRRRGANTSILHDVNCARSAVSY